jgi:hypothetical protein
VCAGALIWSPLLCAVALAVLQPTKAEIEQQQEDAIKQAVAAAEVQAYRHLPVTPVESAAWMNRLNQDMWSTFWQPFLLANNLSSWQVGVRFTHSTAAVAVAAAQPQQSRQWQHCNCRAPEAALHPAAIAAVDAAAAAAAAAASVGCCAAGSSRATGKGLCSGQVKTGPALVSCTFDMFLGQRLDPDLPRQRVKTGVPFAPCCLLPYNNVPVMPFALVTAGHCVSSSAQGLGGGDC